MQADPWWSFAMAFNVFVVFYCNIDPTSFRKYVWLYIIVCFGGPLIPAIALISIRDEERGPVYGDAAVSRQPLCYSAHKLTAASSGAGSVPNGVLYDYMLTTFPYGSAYSSQS